MKDLKTSEEWNRLLCKKLGVQNIIYDPDGWNRMDYQYSFHEEKIDKDEFVSRLMKSTLCGLPTEIDKVIKEL